MEDSSSNTALGYSSTGSVRFTPPPSLGAQVTGYLDVSMVPAATANAVFGVPCPDGLGDCGQLMQQYDGGLVASCTTVQSGPMCTTGCAGNGDCAVGNGVCVGGWCTQSCASNAACTAPLRCLAGDGGAVKGCF
jgi:hypothetical protein